MLMLPLHLESTFSAVMPRKPRYQIKLSANERQTLFAKLKKKLDCQTILNRCAVLLEADKGVDQKSISTRPASANLLFLPLLPPMPLADWKKL